MSLSSGQQVAKADRPLEGGFLGFNALPCMSRRLSFGVRHRDSKTPHVIGFKFWKYPSRSNPRIAC